uniref:Uncharacterized protein n=1 Tax=Myotis myotis TaxID=51298 RepID=A0A7J7S230_MYOMY|nr:hypothetical protein mMyoMyo1_010063 [Myotis myotis]
MILSQLPTLRSKMIPVCFRGWWVCNRPRKMVWAGEGCLPPLEVFHDTGAGSQTRRFGGQQGESSPFGINVLKTSAAKHANNPLAPPLGRCCLPFQEVCVNQSLTGEIEHFILEARSLRTMTGISSFCPARAVCRWGDKSPGVGNKGYRELGHTGPWGGGRPEEGLGRKSISMPVIKFPLKEHSVRNSKII